MNYHLTCMEMEMKIEIKNNLNYNNKRYLFIKFINTSKFIKIVTGFFKFFY